MDTPLQFLEGMRTFPRTLEHFPLTRWISEQLSVIRRSCILKLGLIVLSVVPVLFEFMRRGRLQNEFGINWLKTAV